MKLTYYKIKCQNDADIYSIRTKTKKEAIQQLKEEFESPNVDCIDNYADYRTGKIYIQKIVIEYKNGFDLMDMLKGSEYNAEEVVCEYMYEADYFGENKKH